MLEGIEFKNKQFDNHEENNLFSPLTENTIVLCNNYNLMMQLAEEIKNTINGDAEYNEYYCDDNDVGVGEYKMFSYLQKIIQINNQQITLSLEPSIIYKAKKVEDIWFADFNSCGTISIWPLTIFEGYEVLWSSGLDKVYKDICNGRYGCFDGCWIKVEDAKK